MKTITKQIITALRNTTNYESSNYEWICLFVIRQLVISSVLLTAYCLLPIVSSAQVIAGGGNHSLAVCSDGTAQSWGDHHSTACTWVGRSNPLREILPMSLKRKSFPLHNSATTFETRICAGCACAQSLTTAHQTPATESLQTPWTPPRPVPRPHAPRQTAAFGRHPTRPCHVPS